MIKEETQQQSTTVVTKGSRRCTASKVDGQKTFGKELIVKPDSQEDIGRVTEINRNVLPVRGLPPLPQRASANIDPFKGKSGQCNENTTRCATMRWCADCFLGKVYISKHVLPGYGYMYIKTWCSVRDFTSISMCCRNKMWFL